MNNVRTVWAKLYRFGKYHKLSHELAEEFAQEAFTSISQGRKASFSQLLCDFKRKEFGDSRALSKRNRVFTEYDRSAEHEHFRLYGRGHVGAFEECGIDERDITNRTNLAGINAIVYDLIKADFELNEIADYLCVTQSRISQIYRLIKNELTDSIVLSAKEKDWSSRNTLLEIEWLTL